MLFSKESAKGLFDIPNMNMYRYIWTFLFIGKYQQTNLDLHFHGERVYVWCKY